MQNLAPLIFNIITYLIVTHVYNQFSSTWIPPITSVGFLFLKNSNNCIYCGLCWAFVAVRAFLQLQQAGLLLRCCDSSSWSWLLLQSGHWGVWASVVGAWAEQLQLGQSGLRCSTAYILNLCILRQQAD